MKPPLPVRVYARCARILGGASADAGQMFADMYAEARAQGRGAALRLWLRAMIDLPLGLFAANRPPLFSAIGQDGRWAARAVRQRPAASAAIIVSIGLAIGANTAAFSVINAFMLRSWGADGIDRVVRVREDYAQPGQAPDVRGFTMANFGPWQRENTVFEAMAAGTGASATLIERDVAERVAAGVVTANFFDVLGIHPAIGRTFTAEEDSPDRRDAVILGDALWRSRFGADANVLGRVIELNGRARTIVGVMPQGLKHPYQSDLWVPMGYREDASNSNGIYVPARLKVGVTVEQANREMKSLAQRRWREQPSTNVPTGAAVSLLRPEMLGRLTNVLYALAGAAALVLIIAMANVSNLLMAQSFERGPVTAVRWALGDSPSRLPRLQIVHSVLLAAAGAALGLLLAFWSVRPLIALSPLYGAGEFDIEPRLDMDVVLLAAALALFAGVVFGLLPALAAARGNASPALLREAGRSRTLSPATNRALSALVVAELALAVVLLAAGGAMARSWWTMQRGDWGVERGNALTFDLAFAANARPDRNSRMQLLDDVIARVRNTRGVSAVGATSTPPFYAGTEAQGFNIENADALPRGVRVAHFRAVTPGYFAALRAPLIVGRDFTDRDRADAPPVAIVSQSLANRYWPAQNPIGRRMKAGRLDSSAPWIEVVGVVGSLRENDDEIPAGDAWYVPHTQAAMGNLAEMTVIARTTGDPVALMPSMRSAVAAADPRQPISDLVTLDARFARFTATERLSTTLTAGLAGLGVFLAALGIYAMLSFSISRRMAEMAVRVALGARPSQVRAVVLKNALWLVAASLIVGAALDWGLTRLGVSILPIPAESSAFLWAAAGVAIVALVSSAIPAARAAKADPIQAMRS